MTWGERYRLGLGWPIEGEGVGTSGSALALRAPNTCVTVVVTTSVAVLTSVLVNTTMTVDGMVTHWVVPTLLEVRVIVSVRT